MTLLRALACPSRIANGSSSSSTAHAARSPALYSHARGLRSDRSRAFSLWPASAASTSADLSALPVEVSEALLEPTFFTPISDALLSLSSNYVALIPLYTIAFRLLTTLPVTIWQRRRTRKFSEDIVPIIKLQQATTERRVREECRQRRASFEEYQKEFKKRAAADVSRISKAHGVHPTLTLLGPPLVHVPLFIGTTLTLRDLCDRSISALPLDPSQYASLQDFASTPFLWCPSLALQDPTFLLPLAVGLATMSNVEVSSINRRRLQEMLAGPVLESASPSRSSTAVNRATISQRLRRRFSSSSLATAADAQPLSRAERKEKERYLAGMRDRVISNILRVSGVLFVPVAMFAPSAVCAYWITSNLFTLVQNLVFARIDTARAAKKQIMDASKRA